MEKRNYSEVERYVFSKLDELPKKLCYHDKNHAKEVVNTVEKLAKMEKVQNKGILILKTAALFHDVGHLKKYDGHELEGAKIAQEFLPKFNYNKKDINRIQKMILSTKMPQNPKTKYEKILCDADLDNFGRRDFFVQTEKVRKELWKQGKKFSKKEWYKNTLKLMENHNYFTKSARKIREELKKKNIERLKTILGS